MKKILKEDKLQLLDEENGEKYYLFTPTWFHLFPKSGQMHKMTKMQVLRFLMMKKRGYRVYIAAGQKDNVMGELTYAVGGSYRYPFSTKKDLIEGPDYTIPEFRRQGVSTRLRKKVLDSFEKEYDIVYGIIKNDNIASIKNVKKSGFQILEHVSANKFTRAFKKDKKGNHLLIAYSKHKER